MTAYQERLLEMLRALTVEIEEREAERLAMTPLQRGRAALTRETRGLRRQRRRLVSRALAAGTPAPAIVEAAGLTRQAVSAR